MEIEIGEYVRTKNGDIRKIIRIAEGKEKTVFGKYGLDKPYNNCYSVAKSKITNHSKNILDLIEVGDYVNGHEVLKIYSDELRLNTENDILCFIKSNEIISILTHEQYENNSYKLEE